VTASRSFAAERSGVYQTPSDPHVVRAAAEAAQLAWFEVDLGRARGKADVFAAMATAAGFPAGFGHNWDALADSLGDLAWRPARGYVLQLHDTAAARRALGAEWATLLDVLQGAAREWKARGKAFIVFVDDTGLPPWQ
jgi:hypothetical protein